MEADRRSEIEAVFKDLDMGESRLLVLRSLLRMMPYVHHELAGDRNSKDARDAWLVPIFRFLVTSLSRMAKDMTDLSGSTLDGVTSQLGRIPPSQYCTGETRHAPIFDCFSASTLWPSEGWSGPVAFNNICSWFETQVFYWHMPHPDEMFGANEAIEASENGSDMILAGLIIDAATLKDGDDALLTAGMLEDEVKAEWAVLKKILSEDDDYDCWISWYEGHLKVCPLDWDVQHQIASMSGDIWTGNAAALRRQISAVS